MAVRYYIAPVEGTGTLHDPYRLKTADYFRDGSVVGTAVYWWQTDTNGLPVSQWGISGVRTSNFGGIDTDPAIDDLFGGNVPQQIDTAADMIAYLQANTVGDVPVVRRNRITAVLDKYAVPRADFTLATPLWTVLGRVFQTVFGGTDDMSAVMSGFFL